MKILSKPCFKEFCLSGEVVSVHKTGIEVLIKDASDNLDGKVHFCLNKCLQLPVVNDRVLLEKREDKYIAVDILPRKNLIARYDFYKDRHQGFAANIDTVFIVTSKTREFSRERLERFLALCKGQNVRKCIVITKADLRGELPVFDFEDVQKIYINALDINDVSKLDWSGTALLMGSSGVGKSTIINTLCGLNLKTREVQSERFANKGRHTTSTRTMYFLSDGRRIIDTPGVRIVGVEGLSTQNRRERRRKN